MTDGEVGQTVSDCGRWQMAMKHQSESQSYVHDDDGQNKYLKHHMRDKSATRTPFSPNV